MGHLTIDQLSTLNAVISAAPVAKEITWNRVDDSTGESLSDTFTIFVRKLAYEDQEQMMVMSGALDSIAEENLDIDDEDEQPQRKKASRKSITAALIATAVRLGENSTEELTHEQAARLHPTLAQAMLQAIAEVNPVPKQKKARARRGSVARAGA